jgi:hypothetical protein
VQQLLAQRRGDLHQDERFADRDRPPGLGRTSLTKDLRASRALPRVELFRACFSAFSSFLHNEFSTPPIVVDPRMEEVFGFSGRAASGARMSLGQAAGSLYE